MSILLKEIQRLYPNAVSVLSKANFQTDSDLQSLTREDLRDLFPEPKNFKVRKAIYGILHKQKPIDVLLRDLEGFIPRESFRAALTSNGVLTDYLGTMKEMKTQLDNVQSFLDAHINLLEGISKAPHHQEALSPGFASPARPHSNEMKPNSFDKGRMSYEIKSSPSLQQKPQGTVEFHAVVSGQTFNAHYQVLENLNSQDLKLMEVGEGKRGQICIVFCPVTSRPGTDAEAAMKLAPDDSPVILVLMHHHREPKHHTSSGLTVTNSQIALEVSVFYHEKMNGLLDCDQNVRAVTQIQDELMKHRVQRNEYRSWWTPFRS